MHKHICPEPERQRLLLLDQRLLPQREEFFSCRSADDVVFAIRSMVVRGAPAIGVTAAWGCWLAALELEKQGLAASSHWQPLLRESLERIAFSRPTAVNLRRAVEHMRALWEKNDSLTLLELVLLWAEEAAAIQAEDMEINRKIGAFGEPLLEDGDTVLTHCNAGALATAGFGTALGVIYAAAEAGKKIRVIADETRPLLQGARLSAYELRAAGLEVTVACDNACALLMSRGLIQKVITGADRIAANGDTANKIGTYGVALLAKHFKIPFYIAAPTSSFDFYCPKGARIPIEERPAEEVTHLGGRQLTPKDVPVYNFAFDITPARLIRGIITECGIFRPPYANSLKKLKEMLNYPFPKSQRL
jgi:methylthioribose-1-phosphate isomerase